MVTIKTRNIIEMAFGFSVMGRVFEPGAQEKICRRFEALMDEANGDNVLSLREAFILWFQETIQTAYRKQSSYGQAAKVADIMLKVCVSYCRLPSPEEVDRMIPQLYGVIDNLVLKEFDPPTGLGDLNKERYLRVQGQLRAKAAGMPLCEYDDILWRELVERKRKRI